MRSFNVLLDAFAECIHVLQLNLVNSRKKITQAKTLDRELRKYLLGNTDYSYRRDEINCEKIRINNK